METSGPGYTFDEMIDHQHARIVEDLNRCYGTRHVWKPTWRNWFNTEYQELRHYRLGHRTWRSPEGWVPWRPDQVVLKGMDGRPFREVAREMIDSVESAYQAGHRGLI